MVIETPLYLDGRSKFSSSLVQSD